MSNSPDTYPNNPVHWRVELDRDRILWVSCDRANETTNALSSAVLREFGDIVEFAANAQLTGMVIQSAKKNGFIAGADIEEFDNYDLSLIHI